MSKYNPEKARSYENRTQNEVIELAHKLGKTAMNCHHLIWMARDHKDPVRAMPIFQPQMYIPAHKALHEECPSVPRFSQPLLDVIRADFTPNTDTFNSLDNLLVTINNSGDRVPAELKEMCVYALESQIPYLRGNIKPAKGYHK